MTRKRFCKLMMARGFSRNGAKQIADYANSMTSYEQLYMMMSRIDLGDFAHKIGMMVQQLSESLSAVVNAFLTALPDLVARANSAMRELLEAIDRRAEGGIYDGN